MRPWLPMLLLLWGLPALAGGPVPPVRSVLVKLRADGPHAVEACAETLARRGLPLAPATADGSDSLDRLAGELGLDRVRSVFRRPDGAPLAAQRRAHRARLARGGRAAPRELFHVYRAELGPGVDPERAAARLAADPHVEYAQPNHWLTPDLLGFDDPFLHSSGSWGEAYPDQWGLHEVGAPEVWERTQGDGVVVAIVDTGVDAEHPDLAGAFWVNPGEDLNGDGVAGPEDRNGVDDDGNGFVDDLRGFDFDAEPGDPEPDDDNGHGTHVAGIVAARGGNGLGIVGVAPRATLLPVRVFPPVGPAESDRVWRGVLYAAENGADIINGSFSCGRVCRSNPVAEDVLAVVRGLGASFVTSAGNLASDVMLKSPERLHDSIVVGALGPDGGLAPTSSAGLLVDVVAPGEDVLSLAAPAASALYAGFRFVGDEYLRLSGTSMAAPHVSGVLALLLGADPSLGPEALRAAIRASAFDLGAPGHDERFGAGLVQALAALAALPVPDLHGAVLSPLPGDTLDGSVDPVPVLARAGGADLAGVELALGRGDVPQAWEVLRLRSRRPYDGSELTRLPLGGLPDGAYVLRLSLRGEDGRVLHEFTPLSLERNRPHFISPADEAASEPDIAGRRVAWQSGAPGPDSRLSLGSFGRTGARPLASAPGSQSAVRLSRGWAAWQQRAPDDPFGPATLQACRPRRHGSCDPIAVAPEPAFRSPFSLSGSSLVYSEAATLVLCRLGGGCAGLAGPAAAALPLLHGEALVWRDVARGLFACSLAGAGGCGPRALESRGVGPEPLALGRRTLAYETSTLPDFDIELVVCAPDTASGSCPPLVLATREALAPGFAPDVSGRRIVWEDRGAHGGRDVYFCERDSRTGACPVQRFTHDAADQTRPRVDGHRLVWQDDRDGVARVVGAELPALLAPPARRVRAGRLLVVPILQRDRGPLESLRLLPGDGGGAPPPGAALLPGRGGRSWLVWRPGADQLGRHDFRVRATRPGGLYTEQGLRVTVVAPAGS